MKVVLASSNPGKLAELRALLAPAGLCLVAQDAFGVEQPEETGLAFVENALIKARAACMATGLPALADDSGVVVDALDGAPGVRSARYAGDGASDADNVARLLESLDGVAPPERGAAFVCSVVYLRHAHDPCPIVCEGIWEGRILEAPRGAGGFGYDPVFFVEALGRTAAELAPVEKNAASHRGQALSQLLARLRLEPTRHARRSSRREPHQRLVPVAASSLDAGNHVYRIFPGATELSPFHRCYETEDTVLRVCAGRFFVHDNGDDPVAAYWALREKAVLYDVPERPVEISGPDASRFLEMIFARRISDLRVGRGRYAVACAFDGGIFMDGILFRFAPDRFWFVQPDGDMRTWLLAHDNGLDVRVSDPRSRVLQVQGPRSFDVMRDASGGAIDGSLRYFGSGFFEIGGQEVYVSRTGWTGELGYETYTLGDRTDCPRLWNHLMAAGAAHGLIFSSMRSMNIRRIEAGILDCGSDFDTSMNPFEAGLGKFVDLEKEGFVGREALLTAGRSKRLYGLVCRDLVPSGGSGVFDGDDRVGVVTTGARSPYLEAGIGYVRFDNGGNWAGRTLSMRSGTHEVAVCEIVDPPFHDRGKEIPRARIRDAK